MNGHGTGHQSENTQFKKIKNARIKQLKYIYLLIRWLGKEPNIGQKRNKPLFWPFFISIF
jgi:hypothetical protein